MARLMRRTFAAPLVRGLLALLLVSAKAWAHPIHTTLSVISSDASGGVVTIRIRAFADDFSAMVARFARRAAPADSSVREDEVIRYVRNAFSVADQSGHAAALEPCGVQRVRELYWVCVRAVIPGGPRHARIRNLMLTELHPDQVNIVQLDGSGTRKTLLFTRNAPATALP